MVELYALVAILGCSRAPAVRFASDLTRPRTRKAGSMLVMSPGCHPRPARRRAV